MAEDRASILVVDDSPTVLKSTSNVLMKAGYRVTTARDGQQALELARNERPDLIVLDIILPKKNGFQVCRQLKADASSQSAKVLLLSSKSEDADREWGARQGADAYLTKPIDEVDLLANIRSLLDEVLGAG